MKDFDVYASPRWIEGWYPSEMFGEALYNDDLNCIGHVQPLFRLWKPWLATSISYPDGKRFWRKNSAKRFVEMIEAL